MDWLGGTNRVEYAESQKLHFLKDGGKYRSEMLSSAIYSIYYSRYSTPYLGGEGEEGGLDGGSCGGKTRDIIIRRYRTTGIYTFR